MGRRRRHGVDRRRHVRLPDWCGEQRRHPARFHGGRIQRGRLGRRHRRTPQGHLRRHPTCLRLLARSVQGRQPDRCPHRQHGVRCRPVGQCRAERVRGGQGRDRQPDARHRDGSTTLRCCGQCDLATGEVADDGRRVRCACRRSRAGSRPQLRCGGLAAISAVVLADRADPAHQRRQADPHRRVYRTAWRLPRQRRCSA